MPEDDQLTAAWNAGWSAGWASALRAVVEAVVDLDADDVVSCNSRATAVQQDTQKQHETVRTTEG